MRVNRAGTFSGIKLKSPEELRKIVLQAKAAGKVIVFTNGCFDLLHYGHVRYLEEAKKKGDILIVALNSDASVRKIKGKPRPIVSLFDRARVVSALACVDYAVSFAQETPFKIIQMLRPDVLIKGADWKKSAIVGSDIVKGRGGKVITIKLIKNHSTSNLIKKIVRAYRKK